MASNELNLRFGIWDYDDITHDNISKTLGLAPLKVYVKGERMSPKFSRISKRNGWIYGTPYENTDNFETQLDRILDILESRIPILKEYSKKYNCCFSLGYFWSAPGFRPPLVYLNKRYHDFIRSVDAEFDLDLYYSPLDKE